MSLNLPQFGQFDVDVGGRVCGGGTFLSIPSRNRLTVLY